VASRRGRHPFVNRRFESSFRFLGDPGHMSRKRWRASNSLDFAITSSGPSICARLLWLRRKSAATPAPPQSLASMRIIAVNPPRTRRRWRVFPDWRRRAGPVGCKRRCLAVVTAQQVERLIGDPVDQLKLVAGVDSSSRSATLKHDLRDVVRVLGAAQYQNAALYRPVVANHQPVNALRSPWPAFQQCQVGVVAPSGRPPFLTALPDLVAHLIAQLHATAEKLAGCYRAGSISGSGRSRSRKMSAGGG
jgi:hypothetical protein